MGAAGRGSATVQARNSASAAVAQCFGFYENKNR